MGPAFTGGAAMRIPPNTHPIARLRNILLTVASLLTIWMLLCLTSCAPPVATKVATSLTSDQGAMDLREAITRLAPIAPIPLARPLVPLHGRFQLRV
jgi:hypothetical protein